MKFESHPWKLPLSLSKSNPLFRPLIWLLNNFQICSLLSTFMSATLVQTPNTSDLSKYYNLQTHLPSPLMPIFSSPPSSQTSLFTLPSCLKPYYNLSVASQCSNRLRLTSVLNLSKKAHFTNLIWPIPASLVSCHISSSLWLLCRIHQNSFHSCKHHSFFPSLGFYKYYCFFLEHSSSHPILI